MSAVDNSRTVHATSRSRLPVYEDLQLRFEWEDNPSSRVLSVFLPGFVKEQLKLTYDEPTRSLNIRGERTTDTNKVVRFNKDFPIPDNARFNAMKARFQSETLIVTVPKQTVALSPPLPPLPPQSKNPGRIASRRDELPKEDNGWSNNKPQEGDRPGKLPKADEKPLNGTEKERPSTLITPLPLPQLQATPAPKPVQIPSPGAESRKAAHGSKDRPDGQDKKGEETMQMKETKVDLEEERKLLVNAGVAAIVLVAVVSYICYYTLGMGRN